MNKNNYFLLIFRICFQGPNKSKIYVEGKAVYPYDDVLKNFGLNWERLDQNEKRIVSYFVFETYKLEAFEKGI